MQTRQEKILACIDPATQKGLEIGALHKPIVTREMGDIRYVDHASTEELKQKYADDPNVDVEAIVDVSYIWGTQTLPELVGDDAPFDYVIASHVIEHVPDLIGWLKEIRAVLKPGGILTLVIPDKRYCFDYHRPLTQPAAIVEAYLQNRRKPSPGQVFEFFSSVAFWNGDFVWAESAAGKEHEITRLHSLEESWRMTNQIVADGNYYDVHCWVFTPASFFELLKTVIQVGACDFKIAEFYPTEGCEFYVSLAAMDLSIEQAERQKIQLDSFVIPNITEPPPAINSDSMVEVKQQEPTHSIQNTIERLRADKQRLQGDKQRLRQKVKYLEDILTMSKNEITAMQSSKFWKLRRQWLELKQFIVKK
ncbi:MAG: methyltransferase domain-containing protein [Elainella sp.]